MSGKSAVGSLFQRFKPSRAGSSRSSGGGSGSVAMSASALPWCCAVCTFENANPSALFCEVCLSDRSAATAAPVAAAHARGSGRGGTDPNHATPVMLMHQWASCGRGASSVVIAPPVLSNFHRFRPAHCAIPLCCDPFSLSRSGRSTTVTFEFAEKAIMLSKAALFRDYGTYDQILRCRSPSEAKSLGRNVKGFDQSMWERHICSIMRDVAVARLASKDFEDAVLGTGDALIAAAFRPGDDVWCVGMDQSDGRAKQPGLWRGWNVLGWALMEARDELKRRQGSTAAAATAAVVSGAVASPEQAQPKRQRRGDGSIEDLAFDLEFGPEAFGPLVADRLAVPAPKVDLSSRVASMVEASVPESRSMRGQRGQVRVPSMLANIYSRGLFMFGDENSALNQQIIPAMKHIFDRMDTLFPSEPKRVNIMKTLVDACLDCQQVQARTIQKLYGDLTSTTLTFEQQLKYSLVGQKEAALQVFITNSHGGRGGIGEPNHGETPHCDLDHTQVSPGEQRAHLHSGYTHLLGKEFGLQGLVAAGGDRFLNDALENIRRAHSSPASSRRGRSGSSDSSLSKRLLVVLRSSISVGDWISALVADINHQSDDADRIIDRDCIFRWATDNMEGDFKFQIFYQEERADEFKHLDPKEPAAGNEYQPFLSPRVLIDMLLKAGMLRRAGS